MKYEYYVVAVSTKSGDEWNILKTNDKEEAIKTAKKEDFANRRDGNGKTIEIRMYEEDIESEDCECFDYDTLDFKIDLLDFIREAEEGNGVQNDSEQVWVEVRGNQYTIPIDSVLDHDEETPFEASMELENNHDHEAWSDLYQQYLED
jgi:hypothetical protein